LLRERFASSNQAIDRDGERNRVDDDRAVKPQALPLMAMTGFVNCPGENHQWQFTGSTCSRSDSGFDATLITVLCAYNDFFLIITELSFKTFPINAGLAVVERATACASSVFA